MCRLSLFFSSAVADAQKRTLGSRHSFGWSVRETRSVTMSPTVTPDGFHAITCVALLYTDSTRQQRRVTVLEQMFSRFSHSRSSLEITLAFHPESVHSEMVLVSNVLKKSIRPYPPGHPECIAHVRYAGPISDCSARRFRSVRPFLTGMSEFSSASATSPPPKVWKCGTLRGEQSSH